MRPQPAVRAALRAASSTGYRTRLAVSSEAVSAPSRPFRIFASTSSSAALPRSFSTSSSSLKKKNKKGSVIDYEEDFNGADEDDGIISGEFEDGMEDSVSSGSPDITSTRQTPKGSQEVSSVNPDAVSPSFAKSAEAWRALLEWNILDIGKKPPLAAWRRLAQGAKTRKEFDLVLELATVYRDRVGPLGAMSGEQFVTRAAAVSMPELALNSVLDRYKNGLEYTMESLYLIMRSLNGTLNAGTNSGDSKRLLRSAAEPGAPTHRVDLFEGSASAKTLETNTEAAAETEDQPAAATTEPDEEQSERKLAAAKMSVIDRMSMVAALTPPLSPTKSHDPVLLAFIPASLIKSYELNKSAAADTLPKIKTRTDEMISLLVSVIDQDLEDGAPSALVQGNSAAGVSPRRASLLRLQLQGVLEYIASQGETAQFRHPVTGQLLTPSHSMTQYLDTVAPDQIEPFIKFTKALSITQAATA